MLRGTSHDALMAGEFHVGRLRHKNDGAAHAPTIRRFGPYERWPAGYELWGGITKEDVWRHMAGIKDEPPRQLPVPANHLQRSRNELRPATLADMIGQTKMRILLHRLIELSSRTGRVLDHVLLVGPAGTGKSTIANCIANELGTDCYQLEAPVGHDTLLDLRKVCQQGDVVFIDEIDQQSWGDRCGRTNNTTPEVLYGVLEDRTLVSGAGVLDFPLVTFIGATADEGQLPDAFVMRFPIRPAFEPYTEDELRQIAEGSATRLGKAFDGDGAQRFARAARLTPRVVNGYVRNASDLSVANTIDREIVDTVLYELSGVTDDGLTQDQQRLLKFLLLNGKRVTKNGTTYQASVSTLATAIGKSRDTKALQLRVEPWLLASGLLQITSGGRALTPKGIARATSL